MAARAMWKGQILVGNAEIPVKLFAAVKDRAVHFRLLDKKREEPVKQQMVNPSTGKVVPKEDIKKAYHPKTGKLVILDEEELAEFEPESSRDIEITRFVPQDQITHQWYDRPYYLGPDDSIKQYFALVEALSNKRKAGVARWVMRKKEYVGALRAEGGYLALITLRHAGEVVPSSSLNAPAGRDLSERELQMAKQLISAMEDEFDIAAYRDEYRDRVIELVEAKSAGKVVKFPRAPRRPKERSLTEVLERSLAAAEKGKKSA